MRRASINVNIYERGARARVGISRLRGDGPACAGVCPRELRAPLVAQRGERTYLLAAFLCERARARVGSM